MESRNEGPLSASAELGKLFTERGRKIKALKVQLEAERAVNTAQFRDRVKLEERIKQLEQALHEIRTDAVNYGSFDWIAEKTEEVLNNG